MGLGFRGLLTGRLRTGGLGLGLRVWGLGLGFRGFGRRVLRLRTYLGLTFLGLGTYRVLGLGFWGLGHRVLGCFGATSRALGFVGSGCFGPGT